MAIAQPTEAQEIRSRLKHPVIDADGHMVESVPVLLEYVKRVGGLSMVEGFMKHFGGPKSGGPLDNYYAVGWEQMTTQERKWTGTAANHWWFTPTEKTRDRATVFLPRLMNDRMEELGLDYAVVYPSFAITFGAIPGIKDPEVRQAMCRAYNEYAAELYNRPYGHRMTAVAAIPMGTPEEALAELDHAVRELGHKAVLCLAPVIRETPKTDTRWATVPYYMDVVALDSDYDYDPVWAKCVELGVAPGFHSTAVGHGWGSRMQPNNLMYNVVGNFAESGDTMMKALFMGGVTRRFPQLRCVLLEGGVGRGVVTFANMLGFWEKRNGKVIHMFDPARLNREEMSRLIDEYGDGIFREQKDAIMASFEQDALTPTPQTMGSLDDWSRAEIEEPEDFRRLFENNFYYGCEADDPVVAWAFNTKVNPFGMKFRAMMGSDIGHCDVPDALEVLPEAYELLEDGLLSEEDFRDFVFTNAVRLYAGPNPDFFKGTAVESEVNKALANT